MSNAILTVSDLHKRFGGVVATELERFEVLEHEVHSVIGPNGAGKSTLIAQLAGELSPDRGRVIFKNEDITHLAPHRRSQLGLARSFQITSVFLEFSVVENVSLAVQAHQGHSFKFWRPARRDPTLREPALRALTTVGLEHRAADPAQILSHGERRQLEIAMVLATEPELLLLDEPMAGMGREESLRMLETLKQLQGTKTLLLIEHDMDVVFALSDRVSVLVNGRLIATGSPEQIRNDTQVEMAYLGEG